MSQQSNYRTAPTATAEADYRTAAAPSTQPDYRSGQADSRAGTATLDPQTLPEEVSLPELPAEDPTAEPGAPPPAKPDLSHARSFLTELHPSGFGELLVTDVWLPPVPKSRKPDDPPVDRQQAWRRRKEYRELNLLKEKPSASFDARTERYWGQVKEALLHAPDAIVDPYTALAMGFADADFAHMNEHMREAKEYGYTSDALLRYGRACLAIGRLKSARATLKKAAAAEPYVAEAWYNLGIAHLFARASEEASEAFQRALDQSPGELRYESALAVARYHERKYDEAEEHFRRTAGATGQRAACRSMLACCLQMQGKWDDARVELGFLRGSGSERWATVADQCLDCVARGEEHQTAPRVSRRRSVAMLKSLATAGAGGAYIAYSFAEHWFQDNLKWASVPVFLLAMVLARSLKSIGNKGPSGEYGNYEQGLPCWQTTTWMRPKRSEF